MTQFKIDAARGAILARELCEIAEQWATEGSIDETQVDRMEWLAGQTGISPLFLLREYQERNQPVDVIVKDEPEITLSFKENDYVHSLASPDPNETYQITGWDDKDSTVAILKSKDGRIHYASIVTFQRAEIPQWALGNADG